ncbi:hypothetical protein ACF0H5_014639 [Mactra antiquata]
MATYVSKYRATIPLRCSVCQDNVKSPVQLPCQHKFCTKCVDYQVARLAVFLNNNEPVTIECPYCREFFMSSFDRMAEVRPAAVNHLQKPDKKFDLCQTCAKGSHFEVATFWCKNCSEFMCSPCAKHHLSLAASKQHIIQTVQDKERYGRIAPRVYETEPVRRGRGKLFKLVGGRRTCEPCGLRHKIRDAEHFCESCNELFCEDCSVIHKSMKMTKGHEILSVQQILASPGANNGLELRCDRHDNEMLNLFCKRCQKSCCAICALTIHKSCDGNPAVDEKVLIKAPERKAIKASDKRSSPRGSIGKASLSGKNSVTAKPSVGEKNSTVRRTSVGGKNSIAGKNSDVVKTSVGKPESQQSWTQRNAHKFTISRNKMEVRKGKILIRSKHANDWIISMAVLPSGDMLVLQLYDSPLKLTDSLGNIISSCSFGGNPWSVAAYNDSLAVVSFSDQKKLQLINISKRKLQLDTKITTRHQYVAVCFLRHILVATCWEGCIHTLNIAGEELYFVDFDVHGQKLFASPEYVACDYKRYIVYVSDYKRNSVTALRIYPHKIDNNPVFVFTDPDLKGPKGIAVDKDGSVYISGMASRNIFRITPGGELVQIYRRRDEKEFYEDISMSASGDKLLVTAFEDNSIIALKLTS